jgi:hypothetical protein
VRITPVNDRALVRLISETHHKPPVLRGLVDSEEEAAVLAGLEGETSARLIAEREGSPALDRRELAFRPACAGSQALWRKPYQRGLHLHPPTGNRFNSGERGAWYCAWDMQTSAQEVGFHRTRELGFIKRYEDEARYVELLADFIGDFPDLHGEAHPALDPDTGKGYPAGQALAAESAWGRSSRADLPVGSPRRRPVFRRLRSRHHPECPSGRELETGLERCA